MLLGWPFSLRTAFGYGISSGTVDVSGNGVGNGPASSTDTGNVFAGAQ
jgi:hypothetical protein